MVVVPENGRELRRTARVKLVLNIFVVRGKRLEASADFERILREEGKRRRGGGGGGEGGLEGGGGKGLRSRWSHSIKLLRNEVGMA
jgi:hypothetical protein